MNRHAPSPEDTHWQSLTLASTCRGCGADIYRDQDKQWVKAAKARS